MNSQTNKPFDIEQDEEKDAAIYMRMEGDNCPINFETTLMKPHNEVKHSYLKIDI